MSALPHIRLFRGTWIATGELRGDLTKLAKAWAFCRQLNEKQGRKTTEEAAS